MTMIKTGDMYYDDVNNWIMIIASYLKENENITQENTNYDFKTFYDVNISEYIDEIIYDCTRQIEFDMATRVRCIKQIVSKYGISKIVDEVLDTYAYEEYLENYDESTFWDFWNFIETEYSADDFSEIDNNIMECILIESDSFVYDKNFWKTVYELI